MRSDPGRCAETETAPRITWLAIPTAGRPQELARSLSSYVDVARRFSRQIRFLVTDNSPALLERCSKGVLRNLAVSRQAEIYYAGLQEKVHYIQALAAHSEAPREVIEFGLLGSEKWQVRTGANRNSIALQTIGHLVLSADDDSVCAGGTFSKGTDSRLLRVGGDSAGSEFWVFRDRKNALSSIPLSEFDVFAEHERLLGRTLGEIGSRSPRVEEGCRKSRQDLLGTGCLCERTILMTFSGVIGDAGMRSVGAISMHRSLSTRNRVMDSERQYNDAICSRNIARQTLCTEVSTARGPMTTAVGLDNRCGLPPFFPGFRNQDGLFIHTVKRCTTKSLLGHLPFVLVHDPVGPRTNECNWAASVRVAEVIIECVNAWACPGRSSSAAGLLKALGKHLIEIAALPEADFENELRLLVAKRFSRSITKREALLARFESKPDFWARDVQRQVAEIRQASEDPSHILPQEFRNQMSAGEALSAVQELIRRFGELLYWWPEILDAARTLARQGTELATKLA